MNVEHLKVIQREILLGFWKVHVLHHASESPVIGQWMIHELRRHGYDVSPGTIYPLLARMEEHGWLSCSVDPGGGLRARREYSITTKGQEVLELLRKQADELYREVVLGEEEGKEG